MSVEPGLAPLIQRYQDAAIILLATSRYSKAGYREIQPAIKALTEVALTNDERAIIAADPPVQAPIIAVDFKGSRPQLSFSAGDPELDSRTPRYNDWIEAWTIFQVILSDYSPETSWEPRGTDEHSSDETPSSRHYLVNSIAWVSDQRGPLVASRFIERLWAHRWIYSAQTCGALLRQVLHPSTSSDALAKSAQVAFEDFRSRLQELKSRSVTLDEWIEGLYQLSPRMFLAMQLDKDARTVDGGDERARFLSEAFADLGAYLHCVSDLGFQHRSLVDQEASKSEGPRQLKRRLLYLAGARIFFPIAWAKAAAAAFVDHSERQWRTLDRYDYAHAASCYLTYLPEVSGAPRGWYKFTRWDS